MVIRKFNNFDDISFDLNKQLDDILTAIRYKYQDRKSVDKDSTYYMSFTDYLLEVDTSDRTVTIVLPKVTKMIDKEIVIKDKGGNAGTNNITINTNESSGVNIDGSSSLVINTNYDKRRLYSDGSNWYTI